MTNRMFAATVLVLLVTIASVAASARGGWTSAQLEELRSMSLAELEPLPADPTNRSPTIRGRGSRAAAVLRHATELERQVACSTCHLPDATSRTGRARTASARPPGAPCRSPERARRSCSGMGARTVSGRRRSARWRARLSTAARARSTRTSSPTLRRSTSAIRCAARSLRRASSCGSGRGSRGRWRGVRSAARSGTM